MIYYDLYLYQKGKNATVLAMSERNLDNLTDEQLVRIAQSGDDEALEAILSRYKNLVYSKSKPYFLAGADDDDIIQEGFIGLYKAVKDFDADKLTNLSDNVRAQYDMLSEAQAAGNPYPLVVGGGYDLQEATLLVLERSPKGLTLRVLDATGRTLLLREGL